MFLRALAPAARQASDEGGAVERASAGPTDPVDVQVLLVQQSIQDAPSEGPVRAAPLQGEVEMHISCRRLPGHRSLQSKKSDVGRFRRTWQSGDAGSHARPSSTGN